MKKRWLGFVAGLFVIVALIAVALWRGNHRTVELDQSPETAESSTTANSSSVVNAALPRPNEEHLRRREKLERQFLALVLDRKFFKAATLDSQFQELAGASCIYNTLNSTLPKSIGAASVAMTINPTSRFVLLDYYFSHCVQIGGPKLRRDYLALCSVQKIVAAQAAFTADTESLFDLSVSFNKRENGGEDWHWAMEKCVNVIAYRDADAAAWAGLNRLLPYPTKLESEHFEELVPLCRSRLARIRLCELVSRNCVDVAFALKVLDENLSNLLSDEQRASCLMNCTEVGYREVLEEHLAICDRVIRDYPTTRQSRRALMTRLTHNARSDLRSAVAELESVKERMELTTIEFANQKLAVLMSLYPELDHRGGLRSFDPERHGAERILAKKLIDHHIESKSAQRHVFAEARIRIASFEHDVEAMNRVATLWMNEITAQPMLMSYDETSPIVAKHFAVSGNWKNAEKVWQRWPASNGGCGSWYVFPNENKRLHIAVCRLRMHKPNEAVELIASAMKGSVVSSRIGLPMLLFHIYRRADQVDDFWDILENWDNSAWGSPAKPASIDILLKQRDRIDELLNLQTEGHWNEIVRQIIENDPIHSGYFSSSLFEPSVVAVACALASEAGEESVHCIRDSLDALPKSEEVDGESVVNCLLENRSPLALTYLNELADADRLLVPRVRNGVTAYPNTNVTSAARRAMETRDRPIRLAEFDWDRPPKGSLPKRLPLGSQKLGN